MRSGELLGQSDKMLGGGGGEKKLLHATKLEKLWQFGPVWPNCNLTVLFHSLPQAYTRNNIELYVCCPARVFENELSEASSEIYSKISDIPTIYFANF